MLIRNGILILAIIAHFILVGAAMFGQVVITPVVLSAPPESLTMFQGNYPYDSTRFWQPTNIIALLLLVVAVGANWTTRRRVLLLTWLGGSILVTIWSIGFVFPEYTSIVTTAFADTVNVELVERGASWQILSLVRDFIFTVLGILPLIALTIPAATRKANS